MSHNYEMMYILRPDLSDEQVQQEVNKYKNFLTEYKAENIIIQIKGKRKLAYPIQKNFDGIYVQMNYQADGKQVAPLERAMRLNDEVIRFLTIRLKDDQTPVQQPSNEEEVPAEVETAS